MSQVDLLTKGLQFSIDGELAYFNYYWLRDNCPSAWDTATQERSFDILQEPDELKAEQAEVDQKHLKVVWPDGHQSEYDVSWLARWHRGESHGDIAIRKRRAWFHDHYKNIARFQFGELTKQAELVADWTEALLDDGISLVSGMPNSDEGLQTLCELIGTVRASFSGYNFDVLSKKNPENLAYTAKALELHTDLPPEELAPGVQFLHCRVNDASGGDSLFVDAVAVANDLKRHYPEYFRLLCELKTPFRYTTRDHDVRSRQHIIELDSVTGEVSGISFSQHLADTFDFAQSLLDEFYPAFRKFGQMMQQEKYLMRFRLNAGECVIFDNHRIAHGRAAFDEGSGDRYLRGCYVDRGELRSKYRVLRAKYPRL